MLRTKRRLLAAGLALGVLSCQQGKPERVERLERLVEGRVEATLREEGFTSVMAAADQGIVTLTGFVATDSERARAREVTNRLPDVSAIEDRMLVRIPHLMRSDLRGVDETFSR